MNSLPVRTKEEINARRRERWKNRTEEQKVVRREKNKLVARKYYTNNREKRRTINKKWREKNREQDNRIQRERLKRWRTNNPVEARARDKASRERKTRAVIAQFRRGDLSLEQLNQRLSEAFIRIDERLKKLGDKLHDGV